MQKNMGTADRAIRTIVAFVVVILILTGSLTGLAAIILGIFAAVLLLTSLFSICPIYLLFKISTARKAEK